MKKLYAFLYDTVLLILGLGLLPWFFYQMLFKRKYRKNFLQRCGFNFPKIIDQTKPVIWIHTVSVGEARAVSGLAELLYKELNQPTLLISSVTETGHAEAKRSMPFAAHHVYLPFDFRWIIRPIIKKVSPKMVLLCETDFWFNFLNESKKAGAFVGVVNGKLSEKSMQRYQYIQNFPLFSNIDLFCLQNTQYQARFSQLNIPHPKLVVTGNLKCGVIPPKMSDEEKATWRAKLGIQAGDWVLTFGSTHEPEEQNLLSKLTDFLHRFPQVKVLLVPRHPERFDAVANLLNRFNLSFVRYSQLQDSPTSARIVLIDTMGVLLKAYQLSDVAVVAGSFTEKVGGHNILEPSFYGVPVLFGPHMHSQTEFAKLALDYEAAIQVTEDSFVGVVEELFESQDKCKSIGKNGLRLISEIQGAKEKTWDALHPHVSHYFVN